MMTRNVDAEERERFDSQLYAPDPNRVVAGKLSESLGESEMSAFRSAASGLSGG